MATADQTVANTQRDGTEPVSPKTIKIQSNDGQIYTIDEGVIEQSSLIKEMCQTLYVDDTPVPMPNLNGAVLCQVVEFCNYHKNDPKAAANGDADDDDDDDDPNKDTYAPKRSDDISEWDSNFIKRFTVANGTIFDIITAANFLGIKTLMAVGCKTIANMVRGKSSTEVREMFTISRSPPDVGLNATEDFSDTALET